MKNKRDFSISGLLFFLLFSFLGCTDDYTGIKIVQVLPKELQRPEDLNQAARSVAKGTYGRDSGEPLPDEATRALVWGSLKWYNTSLC
jgi:hypothetical protein